MRALIIAGLLVTAAPAHAYCPQWMSWVGRQALAVVHRVRGTPVERFMESQEDEPTRLQRFGRMNETDQRSVIVLVRFGRVSKETNPEWDRRYSEDENAPVAAEYFALEEIKLLGKLSRAPGTAEGARWFAVNALLKAVSAPDMERSRFESVRALAARQIALTIAGRSIADGDKRVLRDMLGGVLGEGGDVAVSAREALNAISSWTSAPTQ